MKQGNYYETAAGTWKEKLGRIFVHKATEHCVNAKLCKGGEKPLSHLAAGPRHSPDPVNVAGTMVTGLSMPRCAPSGHAACGRGVEARASGSTLLL